MTRAFRQPSYRFRAGDFASRSAVGLLSTRGFFDPSGTDLESFRWQLWVRGSYASSPWNGTPSVGSSALVSLTSATAPDVGTAVNGYNPAAFIPANLDALATSQTLIELLGDGNITLGWTFETVVKFNSLTAPAANYYDDPLVLGSSGGNLSLTATTSGLRLTAHDSAGTLAQTGNIAISAGQWYRVQGQWTGTVLRLRINAGAWDSVALTSYWAADLVGNTLLVGANYVFAAYADMQMLELGLTNEVPPDTAMDALDATLVTRYALGGVPATVAPAGIATAEAAGTQLVTVGVAVAPTGITTGQATGSQVVTSAVALSPSGVATGEALGTQVVTIATTAAPTGIATAQATGSHTVGSGVGVFTTGIATSEATGTQVVTVGAAVAPGGIATSEAIAAPVVTTTGGATVAPAGIATSEATGSHTATVGVAVAPGGVATAEATGTAVLTTSVAVSPAGVATGEAITAPVITTAGGVTVTITAGIATGEAIGAQTVTVGVGLSPSGIATSQATGSDTVTVGVGVAPTGISTGEATGSQTLQTAVSVSPGGIATGEALTGPVVVGSSSAQVAPAGIATAQAMGSPVVTAPTVAVTPNGIATGELTGTQAIKLEWAIAASGIPSAEALGAPITTTAQAVQPTGIPSGELVGAQVVLFGEGVSPPGISSAEALGLPIVVGGSGTQVLPTGIARVVVFGIPNVSLGVPQQLEGVLVMVPSPSGTAVSATVDATMVAVNLTATMVINE